MGSDAPKPSRLDLRSVAATSDEFEALGDFQHLVRSLLRLGFDPVRLVGEVLLVAEEDREHEGRRMTTPLHKDQREDGTR